MRLGTDYRKRSRATKAQVMVDKMRNCYRRYSIMSVVLIDHRK